MKERFCSWRVRRIAAVLVLVVLAAAVVAVLPRVISAVKPVATPTATPVPRPAVSPEELYVASVMVSAPIAKGCRYDDPVPGEQPMFLFQSEGEGIVSALDNPELIVVVGWRNAESEVCGIAATWTFATPEEAYGLWQTLVRGLPGAKVKDSFEKDSEAAAAAWGANKGKYVWGAIRVYVRHRMVVWVISYAETVEQADDHVTAWLSGFLSILLQPVSSEGGAGQ